MKKLKEKMYDLTTGRETDKRWLFTGESLSGEAYEFTKKLKGKHSDCMVLKGISKELIENVEGNQVTISGTQQEKVYDWHFYTTEERYDTLDMQYNFAIMKEEIVKGAKNLLNILRWQKE